MYLFLVTIYLLLLPLTLHVLLLPLSLYFLELSLSKHFTVSLHLMFTKHVTKTILFEYSLWQEIGPLIPTV